MKRICALFLIFALFSTQISGVVMVAHPADNIGSDAPSTENISGQAYGSETTGSPTGANENPEEGEGETQPDESTNNQDSSETIGNPEMGENPATGANENPEEGEGETQPDESTNGQDGSETTGNSEIGENENPKETGTIIYDPQPLTKEEVQALIDAYESLPWYEDVKPRWQYEVSAELMPYGWHCELVDWDEAFGAEYYTFFPNPVPLAAINFTGTTGSELQTAISNAASGDTIVIANEVTFSGGLTITKQITIRSAISGNPVSLVQTLSDSRHFFLNPDGNLTLENITLDGGGVGGGVHGFGGSNSSLTLNNGATIRNCYQSSSEGGGVRMDSGKFTLNGGKIIGNRTVSDGGGVYLGKNVNFLMNGGVISENMAKYGGGICARERNNVEISNGTVIDLNIAGYGGGGISAHNGSFVSMERGVIIEYNEAVYGGGIYATTTDSSAPCQVTIANSSIKNNIASSYGGGICSFYSAIIMNNSNICYNTAVGGGGISVRFVGSTLNVNGGSIDHNKATLDGGGIYADKDSAVTVTGSQFLRNNADRGGGIFAKLLTITDSEISSNIAAMDGGGICLESGSVFIMNGGLIRENNADIGGGINARVNGNLKIHNAAVIEENTARLGAGISFNGGQLNIAGSGTTIRYNTAGIDGGGIRAFPDDNPVSTVTIENQASINNNKAAGGGGIHTSRIISPNDKAIKIVIDNAKIYDNEALELSGGGIFHAGGSFTAKNGSIISGNKAGYMGGGIMIGNNSTIDISQSNILENINREGIGGGGISTGTDCEITISDSTFSGNNALDSVKGEAKGGGLYTDKSCTFTANNCRFIQNEADVGGALYIGAASTVVMKDSVIEKNVASKFGGGIYVHNGNPGSITISNSTIAENQSGTGGGVYSSGEHSLTVDKDSVIKSNVARFGGGICTIGGYLLLSHITIIDNSAQNHGGGIYVGGYDDVDCVVSVTGSQILNNNANIGGGIYADVDSAVTVTGSRILGNTSVGGGGGIYARGSDFGPSIKISNSVISENRAPNGGGAGIYTEKSNYENLNIDEDVIFSGNRASRAYAPPDNAIALWSTIKTASSSLVSYSHPVNNYDINTFTFTVTFNSNGGSAVTAQTLAFRNKVVLPYTPTKVGAYFEGWYTDSALTIAWDFANDVVTENIILYAKWLGYNLNISIPIKLLWAAFDGDYDNVDSPDYRIINHSNVPFKVFGTLKESDDYPDDEGIELVANVPEDNQLRLDIIGGDGFSGLGNANNPFPYSFQGLLIDQPPVELGILGGERINQVSGNTYGTTGWFKIGGRYGGPKPAVALRPVFGMEFAFEAVPQEQDNTILPIQIPGDPDRGFMPEVPVSIDISRDFRGKLVGWIKSDGSDGEINFNDQLVYPYAYWQLENILDPSFKDYSGMTISVLDSRYTDMFSIGQDRNGRASIICSYVPTLAEYSAWISAYGKQHHPEITIQVTLTQGERSVAFKITILYDGLISVVSI